MRRHLASGVHVADATRHDIGLAVTAMEQDGDRRGAAELSQFLTVRRRMLRWVSTDGETGEQLYRTTPAEFDRVMAALKRCVDALPEPFTVRQIEEHAYNGRPGYALDARRRPFAATTKEE